MQWINGAYEESWIFVGKSRHRTFFGHLARMDENADASQAIFEPPPENWRRPPGLPRTTWTKSIHDELPCWILGYMRLEIWRKIGLSWDWRLCTALRTRSGACYSEIIVLIQHPVTVHSSVVDIGRYFFQLILHIDVVYCNCSNSRIWLFIHITLTFYSVLSPSHFILALWQSCVLSTVVLINEYEYYRIGDKLAKLIGRTSTVATSQVLSTFDRWRSAVHRTKKRTLSNVTVRPSVCQSVSLRPCNVNRANYSVSWRQVATLVAQCCH